MPAARWRHVVLERIKHGFEVPAWVDAVVGIIGLVHIALLGGGMVAGMGIALGAGMAPSWTSAMVSGMGAVIPSSTALYALSAQRPDLLSVAMYGLVALVAWVACVATVLYILVAVDSPVAEYIICHWNETEAAVAAQTLTAEALGDDYLSVDGRSHVQSGS